APRLASTSGGSLRSLSKGPPGARRKSTNVSVATTQSTITPWRNLLSSKAAIALNVTQRAQVVMSRTCGTTCGETFNHGGHGGRRVARMKRSEIPERDDTRTRGRRNPDSAFLHPGYEDLENEISS